MLDCLREQRTKQELDAGLREKILAMGKAARLSHKLQKEIEATIEKKDLDRTMVYWQA